MQLVILLLLVAALALLVLGLTTASSTLVVVSIVVSLVAVVAIVRARQRRITRLAAEAAERRRLEKIEKDKDETTKVLAVALAKNRAGAADENPKATAGLPEQPVAAHPIGVDSKHQASAAVADPVAAGEPVAAEPQSDLADPDAASTRPPLTKHGNDPVWVIDGRPRYHAWNCDFITGRGSESVPLAQAVEDGFTPCSLCDPDTALAQ